MWGFMMYLFVGLADSMHAEQAQGGKKAGTFKSAAVLLLFTIILIVFNAEGLVLADTNYPKFKCDSMISAFHLGSVVLGIPLILFCFYYMAKTPFKGSDAATSARKMWITTSYTVVTSGWYVVGCYWVFKSKTCYDKNPTGYSLALAYCIAFLIFLGVMATYCCFPPLRRRPDMSEEPMSQSNA